ncbi:hypothetical protein [Longimicrobium terrae]|uniref:Tetratricopeptide (TPR) repeat protein n=1 Tax=Longimicrobium terrae TaxID=1639882 RepID=A0A841H208_9BACT|nr:hypothetical protein [Longimicrobium terrae]MBB4637724.1 tetratricopeptide (TPR) repeat protein [Longimicrobium terrae]MBB6072121.1 tetratricopeptide (TPR) repeat protein [Longimicrobium terrae]NNC29797.1 hypothetical protein [Longimicrobium terrae]
MIQVSQTALAATGTLQRISETERGERARRAGAGALVLRVVEQALGGTADEFSLRRAEADVTGLQKSPEKTILLRIIRVLRDGAPVGRTAPALVSYACELERTRRLPEADAAVSLAFAMDHASGATALHAARLARKLGERERALALYCAARDLEGGDGQIARLAAVGEAVVSENAEEKLGNAIRLALRAGDAESAAVGLEERAKLRRARGNRRGAGRDLAVAAARYTDAVDRARACHELAGTALAAGDADAAREALLIALDCGDAPQRDHAQSRLHTLARDLGDQVGTRRWRSFTPPSLVSLSAYRPSPARTTLAPRLRAWRESAAAVAAD